MAESEDTKESVHQEGAEEMLAEADIDAAIAEADPEFFENLREIGGGAHMDSTQDEATGKGPLHQRIIFRLRWWVTLFKTRKKDILLYIVRDIPKQAFKSIKKFFRRRIERMFEAQRNFRYLPLKLKLAFFGILVLMGVTGFFVYRSLTQGIVHEGGDLFIRNLEGLASHSEEYDPDNEVEPFYENLRSSTNILLMPKMVVNIRPSSLSGRNPMAAFELYLEGAIPEVVVELKDREIEMRDLMQRVAEGFSFDQLDTADGKQALCERMQREINQLLVTGRLKNVLIKTMILKP